jgi:hypothetical protein
MRYLICLIGLLALQAPMAYGQQEIWFSPLTMSAGPTTGLTIRPGSPVQAIRITAAAPGSFYVNLGLTLPNDIVFDYVTVCYQLDNTASNITQIRLTRMTTPDAASVLEDDATILNAPVECYTSELGSWPVEGAMTLSLRLNFTNVAHGIEIGGVAIGTLPSPTAVADPPASPDIGASLLLKQNRPNPFNPSTVIGYELKQAGEVDLRIFSATGRLVRTLMHGNAEPGAHRVEWDGRDDAGRPQPSGAYYYRLTAGDLEESKPMILLR